MSSEDRSFWSVSPAGVDDRPALCWSASRVSKMIVPPDFMNASTLAMAACGGGAAPGTMGQ
jgi:hypothetical protein